MSNIHGFNDNNNNDNNQDNNRNYFEPQGNAQEEINVNNNNNNMNNNNNNRETTVGVEAMRAYLYKNNGANPRNEKFCPFLKITMCPVLSFKSFTFVVLLTDIILYIVCLCYGLENTDQNFLCPKRKTLEKFGALGYGLILKSPTQLYRLVTNSFLHLSFFHIFSNSISGFIFATLIEKIFQFWKFSVLYLGSGILGSLAYIIMSQDKYTQSVGASISLFGVFGAYFAYWIINYRSLSLLLTPTERCCMLNLISIMLLFLLLIQIIQSFDTNDNVNIFGHFAGMCYGFFLTFVINPPDFQDTTACFKYLYWKIAGIIVVGGSLVGGTIFLSIKYSKTDE